MVSYTTGHMKSLNADINMVATTTEQLAANTQETAACY